MLDKQWPLHILRANTSVKKESLMTATRPGKALAEELQAESHSAMLHPTMARLIEAVASRMFPLKLSIPDYLVSCRCISEYPPRV